MRYSAQCSDLLVIPSAGTVKNSRLAYAGAQQSGRQLRTGGAVQEEAAGGEAETSQEEPGARSRDEDRARVSFAYSNIMILCLRSIAFIS